VIFLQQSELAWKSLQTEDWDQAQSAAQSAAEAADGLGRSDESSIAIRHLDEELQILKNLSSYSPIEITQDIMQESEEPDDDAVRFRARHGDRWLILQGNIVKQPTPEETRYWLEYPFDLPDQQVRWIWREPPVWFENHFEDDERRSSVVLAVQMSNLRKIDDDFYEVVLSPENTKLWRTPELLATMYQIDLDEFAETQFGELLEAQRLTSPPESFYDDPAEVTEASQ